MLEIKGLSGGYNGEDILDNVDLKIQDNQVTVIIGPNGSGKSTLLKSIVRLLPYHEGEIYINNTNIKLMKNQQLAQNIAYLPQGKKAPDIQVRRMVLHGRFPYLQYPRKYRKLDYDVVDHALKQVGIKDLAYKNVNKLSGGTQQKVYIAMSLAQDTPIILMDEPTTYLDISHQLRLMTLVKELAESGKSVVMVLHDLAQAFYYADRIIVMSKGHIVLDGKPDDIFCDEKIYEVFGVKINRLFSNDKWHYYYE